jgi:hypothetical protein
MLKAEKELEDSLANVLVNAREHGNPKIYKLAAAHSGSASSSFRSSFSQGGEKAHRMAVQGISELESFVQTDPSTYTSLGFLLALYYLAEAMYLIPRGTQIKDKEKALEYIEKAQEIASFPRLMNQLVTNISEDLKSEIEKLREKAKKKKFLGLF